MENQYGRFTDRFIRKYDVSIHKEAQAMFPYDVLNFIIFVVVVSRIAQVLRKPISSAEPPAELTERFICLNSCPAI